MVDLEGLDAIEPLSRLVQLTGDAVPDPERDQRPGLDPTTGRLGMGQEPGRLVDHV